MPIMLGLLFFLVVFLLVSMLKSFGINQEYQRGVLFRLGRLGPMKGPGWYWLIPFVDRSVRGDMRTNTFPPDTHETTHQAGLPGRVPGAQWFRRASP